jgi:hypothetical protein
MIFSIRSEFCGLPVAVYTCEYENVQNCTRLRTGRPGDRGSIPDRGKRFLSSQTSVSRPALGPTQPPVQWATEVLSPGLKRGRGV